MSSVHELTSIKKQSGFPVLVVIPRYVEEIGEYYQFPLGLAYIAAAIKKAGYPILGLNLNEIEGDETSIVRKFVSENNIKAVCSGGLSPFIGSLQSIGQGLQNIPYIVGGGVMGGDPLISIKMIGCNYGVLGEGEEAIVELLDAIVEERDLAGIEGIVYRDHSGLRQTSARSAIEDIDGIAWPLYEIFEIDKLIDRQNVLDSHFFHNVPEDVAAPRSIDVITSRSCPFMCTFCFHPIGKKYRERSIDDVINEIRSYVTQYEINMVQILDELFSLRKPRLMEFCKKIKPLGLKWMVQLHTRTADDETLAAMKDAGCVYISYGIESANDDVLRSMAKKTTVEVIDRALSLTYKHNIGIQGNLIFGDTNETLETANSSMQWWHENRNYAVYLSRIQVYPGSPDYIMAFRDGLITDRDAFVETLPTNLNISNINCVDYSSMMFQLRVHGRTLLNLTDAEFVRHRKNPSMMDIKYDCPKCGEKKHFRNAITRDFHKFFIRVFCNNCHHRCDLINPEYVGKEMPEGFTNPANLGGGSMFETTLATEHKKITKKSIKKEVEFIYAHADPDVHKWGELLLENPFSITLHAKFAESLRKIGCGGAALLHYEQALIISQNNLANVSDEEVSIVREVEAIINAESLMRGTYFVSFSSDQAYHRPSRDTGGYKNKQEPDFPDFRSVSVTR